MKVNTQSTREKILDVVFKLVYINGYNGTSMSMILSACEIPKGSLYHFFKSKKELVLCVIKERLAPRVEEFYELKSVEGEDGIETIIKTIEKVAQKDEVVHYGCPMNRLNQEMSALDADFEEAIFATFESVKGKIVALLEKSTLKVEIDKESLAEYIMTTVWGSLSLSPVKSSKERYLDSVKHLIAYLRTLKN